MTYIHPDTIEQIKERADCLDVVQQFVQLKKQGSNYVACSPFTDEKTPSFYVNPSKNMFKCFSSGEGGDAIAFLMKAQNKTYPEALQYLADKYGVPLKHHTPTEEELKEIDEKAELYEINKFALKLWQNQLLDQPTINSFDPYQVNPVAAELLGKRQLDPDIIIQFGLGYAPGSWNFLTNHLKEQGKIVPATKLGIIKKGQNRNYDSFRHRIIFPIHNHEGKLVAFGGRALKEEIVKGKKVCFEWIDAQFCYDKAGVKITTPKIINGDASPIYDKSNVLYGLHIAAKHIRKADMANVVEGYNDVLAMHQFGQPNTVGTCGTALTKLHLKLLLRHTKNIRFVFDADAPGIKAAIKNSDMAIREGFEVTICLLPTDHDPDSFARLQGEKLTKELNKLTEHAIVQIAKLRQAEIEGAPGRKEHISQELGNLISHVQGETVRDTLTKTIAKLYEITPAVFRGIINDHLNVRSKERVQRQLIAKKNEVIKLEGEPHIYPFFTEKTTKDGEFKELKINKARFVNLLKSFGYSRYYVEGSDAHTFVRINDNLIHEVQPEHIIDHIEDFIYNDYDFEARTDIYHTHAEMLWNKFLDGQRSYFNKDIFARVRNSDKIIVNKDTKTASYFYYQNGFVEINADGWELHPYTELSGGIWEKQMNDRDFTMIDAEKAFAGSNIQDMKAGTFANFVLKIAGDDQDRFLSLCSIIGYATHDFYEYKLKAINLTDSSLSEKSDGRSGKTLLMKMLKFVRNVAEINGKEFKHDDRSKYSEIDIYSQIGAINDIVTKGRNKFDFDNMFNDITEGAMVKKLYMDPFRKYVKWFILSNAPLEIHGGSQRDRILEFELSTYFNSNHSPEKEYGIWLGRDFDSKEWMYYDNFMCFCSFIFHRHGIIEPKSINLEQRKLMNETNPHFLNFMDDCTKNLQTLGVPWENFQMTRTIERDEVLDPENNDKDAITKVVINKDVWYQYMCGAFSEINTHYVKQNTFSKWLKIYAYFHYGIKEPEQFRSGGKGYFKFVESKKEA